MVRASFSNTHLTCLCPPVVVSSSTFAFLRLSLLADLWGLYLIVAAFFLSSSIAQHLQCFFGFGSYHPVSLQSSLNIAITASLFPSARHVSSQTRPPCPGSRRLGLRYVHAIFLFSPIPLTTPSRLQRLGNRNHRKWRRCHCHRHLHNLLRQHCPRHRCGR